ncbi:FIG00652725: hypothetical protein [hydrothermal vent metagenome]|uniref:DinB-like domain-containing protein n=1 Tax=hydrothermal vent metagenome TaxID=652676 RepID=A0A3B0TFK3_9ZZZZ
MKVSELELPEGNPYYKKYIDTLGDVELMDIMTRQLTNFPQFIKSIPQEKSRHAYAEGKWTIAEVFQHIADTERIFQYRALRFSRNDFTPLMGFEQDDYVPESFANKKSIEEIITEYKAVRSSTLSLFSWFNDEVLKREGTASGMPMSVAALGFMICGHQKHHRNVIRERYL